LNARRRPEEGGFATQVMTLAEWAAEDLQPRPSRRARRRARLLRFLLCEAIAIGALFGATTLGTSERFLDSSWNSVLVFLIVLSASATALIPVLFYGRPNKRSPLVR